MQPDFAASAWATPLDPLGGPLYLQIVERLEIGRASCRERVSPYV